MPEIVRSGRRRSLVATLLALMLVASACGAASDEAVTATAEETSPDSESSAPSTESSNPEEASSNDSDEEASGDGGGDEAAVENFFPDIDVVNIADGSTLNLAAELGGGDRAVLLWFWAPH